MDQKIVKKLEANIEDAIAEIIVTMGLKKLPLLPARQTVNLMAKAAVAVYETEVEMSSGVHDRRANSSADG